MPKINQEEYEVLKGLDDKWEWIARNYNGALITYTDKPMKNPSLYWDDFGKRMDDRLFQFIQWEDESPYNIQELIEEYLYDNRPKLFIDGQEQSFEFIEESEETEVKNIEWLKEETEKRIKTIESDNISFVGSEYYDEGYIDGMRDVLYRINQLDEPEVLSQEWRRDNLERKGIHFYVNTIKLQKLLVPKQEEVDRAYKDGYEKGREHGFYKGYREGLANKGGEPETVADVVTTFWKSYERLK